MDLTATIAPRSDQKNADDFLTGPQTFTITADIEYASPEQPFGLVLDGDTSHPYKPGKSMRRVLVAAWGPESSVYVGRRLTLYTDPSIKFGGQDVGGIRISHMSHIAKPLKLALTLTKGKKGAFVVQPLTETAPARPARTPAPNALTAAFHAAAITDRTDMLRFAVETVGRDIEKATELTPAETDTVVAALKAITAQPEDGAM